MSTPSPGPNELPSPVSEPLVDRVILQQLCNELDRESAEEMVQMFLDQLPEQIAGCEEALAKGDYPTLEREAHSTKGSAASLGAAALAERARQVEVAAEAAQTEVLPGLLAAMAQSAEATVPALEAWRAEGGS